jgi:hypothetical protein
MDARKCTRCGFTGSLSNFAAIGEGKRHELCKTCWVAVREDRFTQIEVQVDGTELQYASFELSPADFELVLAYLQDLMGLTDAAIAGIRAAGFVPYMQKRNITQLIYKR